MPVVQSNHGIGLIIPPPELRNIVDKTASFVARNGKEFENKIHEKEENNKKFNFLKETDPYHSYYKNKLIDFSEGNGQSDTMKNVPNVQKQHELLKNLISEKFVPDKQPREYEFIIDIPTISPLELDIVKLTAQFVARNGRQFLTDLMNREQKSNTFDFLRPQHPLFQYFAKLLEQYTKILIPPKDLLPNLREELKDDAHENILKGVKYHANWLKYEENKKRLENEKIEKERLDYYNIDWHDFVVVEEVEYHPHEMGNFPPPTLPELVGKRLLLEMHNKEDEIADVEMQIESDEEMAKNEEGSNIDKMINSLEKTPIVPESTDQNVIIKKYDPKTVQKPSISTNKPEEFLISPLTGEKIPSSKIEEHMRIGLLDPRWIEQRDKQLEKVKEYSSTINNNVGDNLKQLAERRTDIFGEGDKEAAIGKKIGEEDCKEKKVIWDGHLKSIEPTARAILKNAVHQIHNKVVKEPPNIPKRNREFKEPLPVAPKFYPPNINQLAFRPPLPVAPPMMMITPPINPCPMPLIPPPPISISMINLPIQLKDDDPPNKKLCSENKFVDEKEFLKFYKGPINIHVKVPIADKSEWKLNGQMMQFEAELTDTIMSIKQKLQEQTDLPLSKQKISFNGIFLKDNNSLAYYNLSPGSMLILQIKERGGRKK